jgi:hypothetical protein
MWSLSIRPTPTQQGQGVCDCSVYTLLRTEGAWTPPPCFDVAFGRGLGEAGTDDFTCCAWCPVRGCGRRTAWRRQWCIGTSKQPYGLRELLAGTCTKSGASVLHSVSRIASHRSPSAPRAEGASTPGRADPLVYRSAPLWRHCTSAAAPASAAEVCQGVHVCEVVLVPYFLGGRPISSSNLLDQAAMAPITTVTQWHRGSYRRELSEPP